jgi:hypothetical protein
MAGVCVRAYGLRPLTPPYPISSAKMKMMLGFDMLLFALSEAVDVCCQANPSVSRQKKVELALSAFNF